MGHFYAIERIGLLFSKPCPVKIEATVAIALYASTRQSRVEQISGAHLNLIFNPMKISLSEFFDHLESAHISRSADFHINQIHSKTWILAQRLKLLQKNGLIESALRNIIDMDILLRHKPGYPSWAAREESLANLAPESRILHRVIWSFTTTYSGKAGVEASLAMDTLFYPLGAVENQPWPTQLGPPELAILFIEEVQKLLPMLTHEEIDTISGAWKFQRWSQTQSNAPEHEEAKLIHLIISSSDLRMLHTPKPNPPDKWSASMHKLAGKREQLPCDTAQAFTGRNDGLWPEAFQISKDPTLRQFERGMNKRWEQELGWVQLTRMGQLLGFLLDGPVLSNNIDTHPQRPNFFSQPELQQDWYERLGPPRKTPRRKGPARVKPAKPNPWVFDPATSKKLFLGKFPVYYGLIYLLVHNTVVDADPFEGQQNRWIGAAAPNSVVLCTELHTGNVELGIWLVEAAPDMPPDEWTEVAEVSFTVAAGAQWRLDDWNGDISKRLSLPAGCFRARFARARLPLADGEDEQREHAQLVIWPTVAPEPELRLRG